LGIKRRFDSLELMTVLAILSLFTIATVFSPLGLGGGILFVPILHYMLGWHILEAVLGSLTMIFMVASGSSLAHSKSGHADNNVANAARIVAIPMAIIGTLMASWLIDLVGDIGIKIIAALVIALVFIKTISIYKNQKDTTPEEIPLSEKKAPYQIGAGLAGTLSGILGIGGGAILVTLNRTILQMDAKKAAGTSFLVGATIVPVALISHIIYDGMTGALIERIGLLPIIIIPILIFMCSYTGAKYSIKYVSKNLVTVLFLGAISLSLIRYAIDFVSHL